MSQRQQSETTGDRRATGGADSRAAATADVVFGILAGATNRYVLQYLIDCDREVSVNELVEYVVTTTGDRPRRTTGEFRGSVRESVESSVAKLESNGFLRYDRRSQVVESTDRTDVVEPHLSLARTRLSSACTDDQS